MDADVMITIAFCLEVFLFALAGGLFVAHEVRKSRSRAAVETGRERLEPAAKESYWLERDLLAQARALTDLPVTQATVASGQPAGAAGPSRRRKQSNDRSRPNDRRPRTRRRETS
jgi:hypothetical protein